jgi:glycerol-1-phosphate dehydrogenase [NAD(P)+]
MGRVIYMTEIKNNVLKIGPGKINEIEKTLNENGDFKKILYVFDPYVDKLYGEIVRSQIEKVGKIKEEAIDANTISYAMNVAERVIATDVDCIVAMGGGKTLDVAKYAAFVAKKPFLSMPTTVANDGIVSPIAVLKRQDNKPKSLGCAMPSMIILDTEMISTCPKQLIKAGIGDTISNYMALKDWEFAVSKGKDVMNGYAYIMSRTSLDVLMKTQYDSICPEFITVLANSLVLSGIAMDYAGSSRPVSGSEHLFSHALDYYCENHNLHGFNVALGTVSVLKLIGFDYSNVLNYLKKFDVDINPRGMGISEDVFVFCMKNATTMRNNRYTFLHEANLEESKLKKLYNELLEEI